MLSIRVLITLATAAVSALTAAAAGAGAAPGDERPCAPGPGSTVWTWPIAPRPAERSGAAAQPAGPPVLRPFVPPAHRWDAGHRGVDLAGTAGGAVYAAGPGTVLFAGPVVDREVVVVGHGALRTSYEPVRPEVAAGDRVTAGERIGTLDPGHCPATACLHWGLLSGHAHATVYYDPLLLLGCGGVRLEPAAPARAPSGPDASERVSPGGDPAEAGGGG